MLSDLLCRGEDLAQSPWWRLGLAEAASSDLPVLQLDSVGGRWPFCAEPLRTKTAGRDTASMV